MLKYIDIDLASINCVKTNRNSARGVLWLPLAAIIAM